MRSLTTAIDPAETEKPRNGDGDSVTRDARTRIAQSLLGRRLLSRLDEAQREALRVKIGDTAYDELAAWDEILEDWARRVRSDRFWLDRAGRDGLSENERKDLEAAADRELLDVASVLSQPRPLRTAQAENWKADIVETLDYLREHEPDIAWLRERYHAWLKTKDITANERTKRWQRFNYQLAKLETSPRTGDSSREQE